MASRKAKDCPDYSNINALRKALADFGITPRGGTRRSDLCSMLQEALANRQDVSGATEGESASTSASDNESEEESSVEPVARKKKGRNVRFQQPRDRAVMELLLRDLKESQKYAERARRRLKNVDELSERLTEKLERTDPLQREDAYDLAELKKFAKALSKETALYSGIIHMILALDREYEKLFGEVDI